MFRNPTMSTHGIPGWLFEFARHTSRSFTNHRELVQHRTADQVIADEPVLVQALHEARDGIGRLNDIRQIQIVTPHTAARLPPGPMTQSPV